MQIRLRGHAHFYALYILYIYIYINLFTRVSISNPAVDLVHLHTRTSTVRVCSSYDVLLLIYLLCTRIP